MDIKDVFLCMDELYCIMIYTNVTWCNYYSFVKFYVVYFNVSSTNINARARLSRYVWYGCYTHPENFAISVDFANSVVLRVWGTKFPILTKNLSSLILQCTIIIQQHIYTFINIFHGKLTCIWQELLKETLGFKTSHKHKSILVTWIYTTQRVVIYLWNSPNMFLAISKHQP
jgi:hypothetical protein